jgi:chromosome segregation ATPase
MKSRLTKALENAKRVAANASGKNKAEANAEVQRLRMELANKTKLTQNLQGVKAELNAALAAKEANKSGANARVANAERKAEELEARLQQAVANKNAEISAIKQGSNMSTAEKNSLITQLRAEQESLKKGLNEIAKTASENASRLQANLNVKIKEAQNAQNALAKAKAEHEDTEQARKELHNAKEALVKEKNVLNAVIEGLRGNIRSKERTAAERNDLRSELNKALRSKNALENSMKKLSEEKESSVAALQKQLENAKSGSNAAIARARQEASELKASLEEQIKNKTTTQANKVRLGGELNAARKAIANFEEKLASVKPLLNEQARKNKEQKNRRDALSVKISLLKGPNVIRRSDIIISALANSSNKELQEAARKKVLSTIGSKNHDGRLSLNANNIHKLDYIARQLDSHKDMSAINMYELLTINKKNKKIRAKGPVPYGANNKRPVSGKPSRGVAPRNTMVRGEPLLSVEDSGIEEKIGNKSKKTRRNGGMIKATEAARQAVVGRRPKPFVGPMAG